ncbi:glycosyltransferase family 4 protein [Laspinema sp. A4]|uniref:glycosyltransferase family 4 protein n=1 Tax=Laspinema sp. D2d TaxID=2953686 RepID=UPI0021BA5D2F|nr:glycosyltransferase family 4 protein [Laspinema sp. D2d]MCT7984811.1 glycosyltransferase family 4 protein [Laspinema sp. D2d]
MNKPVLTIFYQFNPWQSSIGGIQTFIRAFIKYAPDEFELRMVGTGPPGSALGVWEATEYAGRPIQFMALVALGEDNIRPLVPTTISYTAALIGRNLASDFMHFYRIEPTLLTLNWAGDKTLFIQNDIRKQMQQNAGKQAILWQRFPGAYFALEKLLITQFNQIYSCNSESAQHYREVYPDLADRVAFLKNCFDPEIFYPKLGTERETQRRELAQELGLAETVQFVLFAGRFHPQKDPLLLIRAIAALENTQVHLLMAGAGELEEAVRGEIDRLNLSDRITLLGAVNSDRLAQLYQVASAFVLSSVYEGLPLAVLEALACGTPIVTTDSGETPRLLSPESGIVCRERTPEALAHALSQVLAAPTRYSCEACVQTAQPYSAPTVVAEVYREMLHRWYHSKAKHLVSPSPN